MGKMVTQQQKQKGCHDLGGSVTQARIPVFLQVRIIFTQYRYNASANIFQIFSGLVSANAIECLVFS